MANNSTLATMAGEPLAIGGNHTQTTPADELETIKSQYLDDLNLNLERLKMLQAVIDDVVYRLNALAPYINKSLIEQVNTRLGIGQLLAMDFVQLLSDDIEKLQSKA